MVTVEPASHRDARKVLEQHGLPVHEIHKVDTDGVLFVTKNMTAMTAWLTVTEGNTNTGRALVIAVERGFLIAPVSPVPVQRTNPTTPFPLNRNTQF